MGKYFSQCSELILISECVYGSPSPFVKNILDRSLSYLHPNFVLRQGQMHHKRRYTNQFVINAYFYGYNLTAREQETAEQWVQALAINFDATVQDISFCKSLTQATLGGIAL